MPLKSIHFYLPWSVMKPFRVSFMLLLCWLLVWANEKGVLLNKFLQGWSATTLLTPLSRTKLTLSFCRENYQNISRKSLFVLQQTFCWVCKQKGKLQIELNGVTFVKGKKWSVIKNFFSIFKQHLSWHFESMSRYPQQVPTGNWSLSTWVQN